MWNYVLGALVETAPHGTSGNSDHESVTSARFALAQARESFRLLVLGDDGATRAASAKCG